ncbi:hypothetical protein ACFL2C_02160 [Patescibacteria group bacterium]
MTGPITKPNKRQSQYLDWTIDLLIYIVILNIFIEYSWGFYIDSFTISIFTAFVLKASMGIVMRAEHRVSGFFKKRSGKYNRFLHILSVWGIIFLSKFIILEVIDIIFGTHVEIRSFISLILLIVTMMVTKKILETVYEKL